MSPGKAETREDSNPQPPVDWSLMRQTQNIKRWLPAGASHPSVG